MRRQAIGRAMDHRHLPFFQQAFGDIAIVFQARAGGGFAAEPVAAIGEHVKRPIGQRATQAGDFIQTGHHMVAASLEHRPPFGNQSLIAGQRGRRRGAASDQASYSHPITYFTDIRHIRVPPDMSW